MSARYFFHAPDEARNVYGPVPVETLRRWRAEGRLRDDSRLRAEDAAPDAFTTAAEVLSRPLPPAPEPEADPAPKLATEIPAPPLLRALRAGEPIPVSRLISNTVSRYGEALRGLWWAAALIQLPIVLLSLALDGHVDPITGEMPPRYLAVSCATLLLAFVLAEFGIAFMALTLHPRADGQALSFAERAGFLARRATAILWTLCLRFVLILSLFILFLFCVASAHAAPPSPILRIPLYFLASLSGLPAMILFLRYLPSTLIVLFEEKKGLRALRRSGDLVRFNQGVGLISPGDFRLFLSILPAIGAQAFFVYLIPSILAHLHLAGRAAHLADAGLTLAAAALATPLYVLLLVSFYVDALPRVPAMDDPEPAPKPGPKA